MKSVEYRRERPSDDTWEKLAALGFRSNGTSVGFFAELGEFRIHITTANGVVGESNTVYGQLSCYRYNDMRGFSGWQMVNSQAWSVRYCHDYDAAVLACAEHLLLQAKSHTPNNDYMTSAKVFSGVSTEIANVG